MVYGSGSGGVWYMALVVEGVVYGSGSRGGGIWL